MDRMIFWDVTYKIKVDGKEIVRHHIVEAVDETEAIEVFNISFSALAGLDVADATIISIEPYEKKTAAV